MGTTQREHLDKHSQEVSEIGVLIGKKLGYSNARLDALGLAGCMHDIEKIAVPESILAKPTHLDADEYHLINRHALDGAELATLGGAPVEVTDLIESHHGKFENRNDDNEQISNILPVADAISAMRAKRPYQEPRSNRAIAQELHRESGKQFDATVVDAAIAAMHLGSEGMDETALTHPMRSTAAAPFA